MVRTRSMRKLTASRNRSYARRVRNSPCRGKGPATCRRTSGCKYSRGKKRTFCRKRKNTKRMKGGSNHGPVDGHVDGRVAGHVASGSSKLVPHTPSNV